MARAIPVGSLGRAVCKLCGSFLVAFWSFLRQTPSISSNEGRFEAKMMPSLRNNGLEIFARNINKLRERLCGQYRGANPLLVGFDSHRPLHIGFRQVVDLQAKKPTSAGWLFCCLVDIWSEGDRAWSRTIKFFPTGCSSAIAAARTRQPVRRLSTRCRRWLISADWPLRSESSPSAQCARAYAPRR